METTARKAAATRQRTWDAQSEDYKTNDIRYAFWNARDEERKRAFRARKLEIAAEKLAGAATATHCQICARPIEANTGLIAHHGYKRPGHGWQTSSCMGARFAPYEVSRDRITDAIEWTEAGRVTAVASLRTLEAGPETLTVYPGRSVADVRAGRVVEPIIYTRPVDWPAGSAYTPRTYACELAATIGRVRLEIRQREETLKFFRERFAAWRAK